MAENTWLPDIGPSLYQSEATDLARTYRLSFGAGLTATLDPNYNNGPGRPKGRVEVTAAAGAPYIESTSTAFAVVDGELRIHPSNEVAISGGAFVGHLRTDDESATSGAIRLASGHYVRSLDGGDLITNINVIGTAGNVVDVGDGTNGDGLDLNAPSTAKPIRIRIGGSTVATWTSTGLLLPSGSNITSAGFLGVIADGDGLYLHAGPSAGIKTSLYVQRTDEATLGQMALYHGTLGWMFNRFLVGVDTADATVTSLWTWTLPDNKTATITAHVTADDAGGANSAGYVRSVTVKRAAGGAATIVGSVGTPHTAEDSAGWDCTFDVSGNDVRLRVTGAAATTINWGANVDVHRRG